MDPPSPSPSPDSDSTLFGLGLGLSLPSNKPLFAPRRAAPYIPNPSPSPSPSDSPTCRCPAPPSSPLLSPALSPPPPPGSDPYKSSTIALCAVLGALVAGAGGLATYRHVARRRAGASGRGTPDLEKGLPRDMKHSSSFCSPGLPPLPPPPFSSPSTGEGEGAYRYPNSSAYGYHQSPAPHYTATVEPAGAGGAFDWGAGEEGEVHVQFEVDLDLGAPYDGAVAASSAVPYSDDNTHPEPGGEEQQDLGTLPLPLPLTVPLPLPLTVPGKPSPSRSPSLALVSASGTSSQTKRASLLPLPHPTTPTATAASPSLDAVSASGTSSHTKRASLRADNSPSARRSTLPARLSSSSLPTIPSTSDTIAASDLRDSIDPGALGALSLSWSWTHWETERTSEWEAGCRDSRLADDEGSDDGEWEESVEDMLDAFPGVQDVVRMQVPTIEIVEC